MEETCKTVKLSVWFCEVVSTNNSQLEEVRRLVGDALNGVCKTEFESSVRKIKAKEIYVQFISY